MPITPLSTMSSYSNQTTKQHITILEDHNEALSYIKNVGGHPLESTLETIIALTPAAQSLLKSSGVNFTNSIEYLNSPGRNSALEKSSELDAWITEHFTFVDECGVSQAYLENLRWYLRWVINYMLWSIEVINEIVASHSPEQLTVFGFKTPNYKEPFITGKENCFASITQDIASKNNIQFQKLSADNLSDIRSQTATVIRKIGRKIAPNPLTQQINIGKAKQMRRNKAGDPILFTSDHYRLDSLAANMRRESNIIPVLMSDWGDYNSIGWPFRRNKKYPFQAEICINFISAMSKDHKRSNSKLEKTLVALSNLIMRDSEIFTHKDITLSTMISNKLIQGIKPDLLRLHKLAPVLELVLNTMQPKLVISNGCRLDDTITGELCEINKISSLMVTHGSHTTPSTNYEAYEWQNHAKKLINAPYQKTALQSRLAEDFRKVFPEGGIGIRTGPLTWATSTHLESSLALKTKLIGGDNQSKIVVHAGTPKDRTILRFQVYETSDEYIQSIIDLSNAVRKLPDTKLLVMFRPSNEIKFKDLVNLVPNNDHIIFTDAAPLDAVLGFADLLVSYSSTVIEEALANNVPVLQYGAEGRYKHINVGSLGDEENMLSGPVYHINNASDLKRYLGIILEQQNSKTNDQMTYSSYLYSADEVCSITELLP